MKFVIACLVAYGSAEALSIAAAQQVLIEAESFQSHGGWKLDTHFIESLVKIDEIKATVSQRDLTGFEGRCDAILFTKEGEAPSNDSMILPRWRRELLGIDDKPTENSGYDLVVVGGGYSGIAASLSAARLGCKVALIHAQQAQNIAKQQADLLAPVNLEQVLLVAYLGLINGDMLSQALIAGWSQNGVPWRNAGGLVLLTIAAFLVPLTTRRNIYCTHLCPHGAAQQLLKKRLPWQLHLPRWLKIILPVFPAALIVWSVVVAMAALPFSLVDIEPFDAWVFRVAGWTTITIAIVGLVASLANEISDSAWVESQKGRGGK